MTSLPKDFIDQLTSLLGAGRSVALVSALSDSAPVSIRLNPAKVAGLPFEPELPVPWAENAYYLPQRPQFTLDPLLHAGTYYVQEASSMFVEQAFRALPSVPARVLDLCAAPGGKSTLWSSLLPDGALLVANEPVRSRAMILAENMTKWGHPDVVVTNAYPADFAALPAFFDVVAADVPCSGEGMFRKDEGAVAQWSPEAVRQCAGRQREIIADVWPALKPGGHLVYSTCTFNCAEDEDNVVWICETLGARPVPIPVAEEWGVEGDTTGRALPVYHFFPHRTRGEGFFLALLQKDDEPGVSEGRVRPARRGKGRTASAPVPREVRSWLRRPDEFTLFRPAPERIAAVRTTLHADCQCLAEAVRTITRGIAVAEEKGRKLIPCHELAVSTECARDAFPHVPLTKEQALSYLRREACMLPSEVKRGYVCAEYEGHVLGLLNQLGPRANNLYPAEWRIRRL